MGLRGFIFFLALSIFLFPSKGKAGGVSIFVNPFKPFVGVFNIGVEYEIDSRYSVLASFEYVFSRSRYLEKIGHPDVVGSVGVRRYFSPCEPNVTGAYAGASFGVVMDMEVEGRGRSHDLFFGGEFGYRVLVGGGGYVTPRGLVSVPGGGRNVLFSMEALLGKIF